MANTRDYMDYLDDRIGIAPANSQEEFQAAETIVEVMKDHDLEPTIQEFDSRPLGTLMPSILMVILFVGILVCGIAQGPIRALFFLLTIVVVALLVAIHAGHDVFANFGPASRSQNVIAVHRATGDKVVKGSRPIVIVAHYDTPHESMLYDGALAKHHTNLMRASVFCTIAVAVAALIQVLGFMPSGLRMVAWVIGLVAALPLLLLAIVRIAERFSPCTLGSNDNKASVAALLSILNKVRPTEDRVDADAAGREYVPRDAEAQEQGYEQPQVQTEQTYGTRHGKEVLQQLGILPETCEIVYEEPKMSEPPVLQAQVQKDVDDETEPMDTAADDAEYADDDAHQEEAAADDLEPVLDEADFEEDWEDAAEGTEDEQDVAPLDEDDTDYDDAYDNDDQVVDYADDYDDQPEIGEDTSTGGNPVKRVIRSIKGFFSRKKDGEGVSIPRGKKRTEDVDFSEFEETDWDDEDTPSDDLRPISREDFSSSRLSWDSSDTYEDELTYDDDVPVDSEEDREDGYQDTDEEQSDEYDEYDDSGDESDESLPPEETPQPEGAEVPVRQTGVIDHAEQQDWTVVEEEEADGKESEAPADSNAFDSALYQQHPEASDDDYEDDADDLVAFEYELDEEQRTSRPAPKKAKPEAQNLEDVDPGDEIDQTEEETISDDEGLDEESEDQEELLSWDDDLDSGSTAELDRGALGDNGNGVGRRVKGAFGKLRDHLEHNSDSVQDEDPVVEEGPAADQDAHADEVEPKESRDESPEVRDLRKRSRLSFDDDPDDSGILPKDTRGLDTISDSYDVYDNAIDQPDVPDPIDDPTWGQSSYVPPKPKVNVARRAALFDLPDPSEESVDPLGDEDDYYDENDYEENSQDIPQVDSDPTDDLDEADDEHDGRQDNWKGGAAVRSDLRQTDDEDLDGYDSDDEAYAEDPDDGYAEDYEDEASEGNVLGQGADDKDGYVNDEPVVVDADDLQDAILEMGDDYLVSHDIWFVAVGSSAVGHAGIRAFLSNFRQDIRGAFLINLDTLGAGTPTILTKEGLHAGRKSDRRLVRLFSKVADDLHIELRQQAYDWDDTDATPAMRARVRAVTIMGADENGLPALSHSRSDAPENVNPQQVASIVRLVTEVIRRS